tara:strand:+ start:75 stop:365 length:291 start_codon:yes stop_codon:yes gene_type:complete
MSERSPIGRGNGFKIHQVSVRVRPFVFERYAMKTNHNNLNNMRDLLNHIQNLKRPAKLRTAASVGSVLGMLGATFVLVGWATFASVLVLEWMGVIK